MRVPARLVPHACLGALVLLAALAGGVSAATTPSDAGAQLRSAVARAVAAPSFSLQVVYLEQPGPQAPAPARTSMTGSESVLVTYHAPDRVQVVSPGQLGTRQIEVAIGPSVWVSYDSGQQWVAGRARVPGTSIGARSAQELLRPLQLAGQAGDVARSGSDFVATVPGTTLLQSTGLVQLVRPGQHFTTSVRATVAQGRVVSLTARFAGQQQVLTLGYRFSMFGTAPDISAPDPASVVSPAG